MQWPCRTAAGHWRNHQVPGRRHRQVSLSSSASAAGTYCASKKVQSCSRDPIGPMQRVTGRGRVGRSPCTPSMSSQVSANPPQSYW
ncbi:hypothetical protein FKM82_025416 [Ascaphus truei]